MPPNEFTAAAVDEPETGGLPSFLAETSSGAGANRRRKPHRVTEEIIESLRADIALSRLATGDRLPTERDLAKHFGVSQPTIRESLRVLEAMGLVDVRHGSGAYVTGATHQFVAKSLHTMLQIERVGILEVVDLRDVLARYSATRAALHATEEDIEQIEARGRTLDEAATAGDHQQLLDSILAFLAAVSAAAHSPLLFVLENVLNRLVTALEMLAFEDEEDSVPWSDWMQALSSERDQFVAGLRAHDVAATVEARMTYLKGLRARIAAVPALADLRLSDAEATRVLAAAGIGI